MSERHLSIHIPTDNVETVLELDRDPIDSSVDFMQQLSPFAQRIRLSEDVTDTSENINGQTEQSDMTDSSTESADEDSSTDGKDIVAPESPIPPETMEVVSVGITISQDVGAGVLAGVLCEKLRERGVSTILLSQGPYDINEADENKEVAVKEEELKSVIDERLGGTDDDQ